MTNVLRMRHAAAALFAGCFLIAASPCHAVTLPRGFNLFPITGPITNGTAMEFAPDGKLFILEQGGTCEVYEGSGSTRWTRLQADFFANDPLSVDDFFERGLLGIAFDPDYMTNRYVYVYYTTTQTPPHNRIERWTANETGDLAIVDSHVLLMELDALSAGNHNGGAIHFGPDGKLYVGVGENAQSSNAQSLANRLGKILRLNPDPDNPIPDDNPTTFDGLTGSPVGDNRAIWAVGLRNPFTFAFRPGTTQMYINDVGAGTYEEINVAEAGANYGWPTTEGPFNQTTFPNFTHPIVYYHHFNASLSFPPLPAFTGTVITGGAFYITPNFIFPLDYAGDYFFGDLNGNWIRRYDSVNKSVQDFALSAGGPVDMRVGDDGALYYLARFTGCVFRVVPDEPACFADFVDATSFAPPPDGQVDAADLAFLLGEWGANPQSAADIVTSDTFQPPPDGAVNAADLAYLLGAWGTCK